MSFINQRNKLQQIDKLNNSNEVLIKKLEVLNLQKSIISFDKKQQEITLIDSELLTFGVSAYTFYTYEFLNLEEKDLVFIKPYIFLSGSNISISSFYSCWFWRKISNSMIFRTIVYNHTYDNPPNPPLYLTIKFKISNPYLFKTLKIIS